MLPKRNGSQLDARRSAIPVLARPYSPQFDTSVRTAPRLPLVRSDIEVLMRILLWFNITIVLMCVAQPVAADQPIDLEKRGSLIILATPYRDLRDLRVQSLTVEAAVANWDYDA